MRIFPILILTRSTYLTCHAFQLGSEAMVPPRPVVLPRSFDAACSVIPVTERDKGAEQRTTPTQGNQEAGKLNGLPLRSEAGKPMSVPPLARYWKLNLLGLLLLLGKHLLSPVAHDAPVWKGEEEEVEATSLTESHRHGHQKTNSTIVSVLGVRIFSSGCY